MTPTATQAPPRPDTSRPQRPGPCDPTVRDERIAQVNALVQIIGSHGRRFFFYRGAEGLPGRFARMECDQRGQLWWVDDYREARIYLARTGFRSTWRGFSHGGTLRDLVERLYDYVTKGTLLPRSVIGLQRVNADSLGDNIWGYKEEAIQEVRRQAFELPMFRPAPSDAQQNHDQPTH